MPRILPASLLILLTFSFPASAAERICDLYDRAVAGMPDATPVTVRGRITDDLGRNDNGVYGYIIEDECDIALVGSNEPISCVGSIATIAGEYVEEMTLEFFTLYAANVTCE